jgi:hypothetical protein
MFLTSFSASGNGLLSPPIMDPMSTTLPPQYTINNFFETYAQALEQHNTKLMANHYHLPCTMMADDATTIFNEASRLEGLFNQAVLFYKHFGIVYMRPDIRSKHLLTDKIAQVKIYWAYMDSNKNLTYNCNYHYIIRLTKDNKWKIVLSVSVDEKEKMEEWKQKTHK